MLNINIIVIFLLVHHNLVSGNVPILAIRPPGGRLGNIMFEWASISSVAHRFNATACYTTRVDHMSVFHDAFRIGFPHLCNDLAPMTSIQTLPIREEWGYAMYDKKIDSPLNDEEQNKGGAYFIGYFQSYKYFNHTLVRSMFEFRPEIVEWRKNYFDAHLKANGKKRIIVGIHIRRGDKVGQDRTIMPSPSFYHSAMRKYERLFKEQNDAIIWFLVVSEDPSYWNANIKPNERFLVHVHQNGSPQRDLALLAGCTHSIISVGTFGWWGAYLANGRVLYHDEFLKTHPLNLNGKIHPWDYYPSYWDELHDYSNNN